MRSNAIVPVRTAPLQRAAFLRAVAVENISNSSALRARSGEAGRADDAELAEIDGRLLSQSDTDRRAPFWHEQALRAPFVTQLLGQLDGTNTDAHSALLAYRQDARQGTAPFLLDARA